MSDLNHILEKAEQVCKKQDARLTDKRKQVLAILLEHEKAISAYDLIAVYEERYQKTLAPMSAYRILDFLESVNLAHKVNIANKYVACAHIGCEHDDLPHFLFCEKCQRVDELPRQLSQITELTKNLEQTGYQLAKPQIELNCICHQCA